MYNFCIFYILYSLLATFCIFLSVYLCILFYVTALFFYLYTKDVLQYIRNLDVMAILSTMFAYFYIFMLKEKYLVFHTSFAIS